MRSTLSLAGALALIPTTAYAHDGDHSASFIANVLHWLSSPTHSLFALIGGLIIVGLIVKFAKKRA